MHCPCPPSIRRAARAVAVLVLAAAPTAAQERSLYWESLDVSGRLDAEGRLHVAERQTYVFTGDWNGGERRFEVGRDEKLECCACPASIPTAARRSRSSRATSTWWTSTPGSTGTRSAGAAGCRRPPRPTRIAYLLEYVYNGVVRRRGDLYRLEHDFAFPDRSGVIERFALDPRGGAEWQVEGPFRSRVERRDLTPATASSSPCRCATPAPAGRPRRSSRCLRRARRRPRGAGVGIAVLLGLFLSDQSRLGRFSPPRPGSTAPGSISTSSRSAEEIGALWDRRTGPPEVAALIAPAGREGKLRAGSKRGRDSSPSRCCTSSCGPTAPSSATTSESHRQALLERPHQDRHRQRARALQGERLRPGQGHRGRLEQRCAAVPAEAPGSQKAVRSRPSRSCWAGSPASRSWDPTAGAAISILFLVATVYLGPWASRSRVASWRQRVQGWRGALVFAVPLLLICGMTSLLLLFGSVRSRSVRAPRLLGGGVVRLPRRSSKRPRRGAQPRNGKTIERGRPSRRPPLAAAKLEPEPRGRTPGSVPSGARPRDDVSRWFHAFGGARGGITPAPKRLERRRRAASPPAAGAAAAGLRRRGGRLGGGGHPHLRRRGFAELSGGAAEAAAAAAGLRRRQGPGRRKRPARRPA